MGDYPQNSGMSFGEKTYTYTMCKLLCFQLKQLGQSSAGRVQWLPRLKLGKGMGSPIGEILAPSRKVRG